MAAHNAAVAADDDDKPPQPRAVLRGHKAAVHAAVFCRANERLLTGDAGGFVVAWDLAIMRPRAVWQAHQDAILGLAGWGRDKIITHGRDNSLIVWKLSADDEANMSTTLPLDPPPVEPRTKPWMLHRLPVNTMNFCSFAAAPASALLSVSGHSSPPDAQLLLAVPNTLASEAVDIYQLPSQTRSHTVKLGDQNGMAMALALVWLRGLSTLIVGFENGVAVVAQLEEDGSWTQIYRNQSHSQPILSLDVAPDAQYFLTSSADAIISKHPLLIDQAAVVAEPNVSSCSSTSTSTETHGPDAGAESSFTVEEASSRQESTPKGPISLLSASLAAQPRPEPTSSRPQRQTQARIPSLALQVVNTKHSGQQSLRVRSDGQVFATAGWDSKVRVYSAKTMREVAVLKWHSIGCFAVAFADLSVSTPDAYKTIPAQAQQDECPHREVASSANSRISRHGWMTVKERRLRQAKTAHWLAAGSKDGKVSLWDIF